MHAAWLNVKITIQKKELVTGELNNRVLTWKDHYTCHATGGGESGKEDYTADDIPSETEKISFTIRYCSAVRDVDPVSYRVLFQGQVYNILSVDHMNFKKKSIKLICEKMRRSVGSVKE